MVTIMDPGYLQMSYCIVFYHLFQFSSDYPMSLAEMMEEDDFECDDDDIGLSHDHRSHDLLAEFREPEILTDSQFLSHFQDSSHDYCSDYEVSVVQLYKKNIFRILGTSDF